MSEKLSVILKNLEPERYISTYRETHRFPIHETQKNVKEHPPIKNTLQTFALKGFLVHLISVTGSLRIDIFFRSNLSNYIVSHNMQIFMKRNGIGVLGFN